MKLTPSLCCDEVKHTVTRAGNDAGLRRQRGRFAYYALAYLMMCVSQNCFLLFSVVVVYHLIRNTQMQAILHIIFVASLFYRITRRRCPHSMLAPLFLIGSVLRLPG